ncbi:hypothetical protein [Rheinheimera sp. WS51]|uniref:hypothetical protein n=1 Tax=Rheinheimera sp. WS51 TaxID=3425886 RepID=UPI003D93CE29
MDNNTDLVELTTVVQRCIATTDNPFAAEKPDTRQLTIEAIELLTGQYRIADIITALTAEKERLTGFTQQRGGMLAYELSLSYREALYNCDAAIAFLHSTAVQQNSADNANA